MRSGSALRRIRKYESSFAVTAAKGVCSILWLRQLKKGYLHPKSLMRHGHSVYFSYLAVRSSGA
jgi:hypothetical protein